MGAIREASCAQEALLELDVRPHCCQEPDDCSRCDATHEFSEGNWKKTLRQNHHGILETDEKRKPKFERKKKRDAATV